MTHLLTALPFPNPQGEDALDTYKDATNAKLSETDKKLEDMSALLKDIKEGYSVIQEIKENNKNLWEQRGKDREELRRLKEKVDAFEAQKKADEVSHEGAEGSSIRVSK
jgi:archaellum component FlaD/FlaE